MNNVETVWVKSLSGDWYSFSTPISLGQELRIISILTQDKSATEIATSVVSEVLGLPPPMIDDDFTGDQVLIIFQKVFPKYKAPDAPTVVKDVQLNLEDKKLGDPEDAIATLIAFLSYFAHIQPSEILRLPRATVDKIFREVTELLEKDKEIQFQLSTVNALNMIFGGDSSGSTSDQSSSSAIKDPNTIDLSSIDDMDLNQLRNLEGVEVRIQ